VQISVEIFYDRKTGPIYGFTRWLKKSIGHLLIVVGTSKADNSKKIGHNIMNNTTIFSPRIFEGRDGS
jgi:predicted ATP-grasp superfamily ATP-dependent carboligase